LERGGGFKLLCLTFNELFNQNDNLTIRLRTEEQKNYDAYAKMGFTIKSHQNNNNYNSEVLFNTLMGNCSTNKKLFSGNIKFIPILNNELTTIENIRSIFLKK
jgi:hypothetical protein